ncbi:MAG: winged helix-turn-helix domain-containing protein, partial [Betaproteobacteria bacterium]|nr:winged helix-turn-helix domain-containing protein [Betaproteobacteria bacterium]
MAELVRRKFGVTYDQSGIWHVLRRLNWTQQKPERQARERDEK